jgi:hypothetical protein
MSTAEIIEENSDDADPHAPPGVFRCTSAWRRLLPDWNAKPAKPKLDRDKLLAAEPLSRAKVDTYMSSRRRPPLPALTWDEVRAKLVPDVVATFSADDWTRVFVTASQRAMYPKSPQTYLLALDWAVPFCAAWAGVETAVTAYARLYEPVVNGPAATGSFMRDDYVSRGGGDGIDELRDLIATLDEPATLRVRATLAALAAHGGLAAVVAAALMPRDNELVDLAITAFETAPLDAAWQEILRCDLSVPQAARVLAARSRWYAVDTETALRLSLHAVRLPAAQAEAALDAVLDQAQYGEATAVAKLVRALDTPAAMRLLLKYQVQRHGYDIRDLLDDYAKAWPVLAIVSAAQAASTDAAARDWLSRFLVGYRDEALIARERVDAASRDLIDALLPPAAAPLVEASRDAVPAVLRDPPWLRPVPPKTPPSARLDAIDVPVEVVWPDGLEARWRAHRAETPRLAAGKSVVDHVLGEFRLTPDWLDRLAAGERPPEDLSTRGHWVECLMLLPDAAGITLWTWANPANWYDRQRRFEGVAARYGAAFVPGLVRYAEGHLVEALELALPFRAAAFAPMAANALRTSRKARNAAQAWLTAHAALVATVLLPAAQRNDKAALDAQYALRWLARNGRADALAEGAERHGDAGRAVLDDILGFDPLSLFPARLPALPGFWMPRAYARLRFADGTALPAWCHDALGTMLAFSTPDAPYAGLDDLRAACTSESLAAFAWDLFESWLAVGAPSKEGWAFTTLGAFGGDAAARRLAPLVRAWPGENANARAVVGLDVLAAIGSDVALMHLNGIAQKVKFKALQQQARARIDRIAEARGLTAEELADRVVPDLGLDDDGGAVLDFGPRAFRVGFDEELKPFVRDAQGVRLKDLPKPGRDDDATLARAATDRYKALKKDVRALASLQIERFERAMVERRRWLRETFDLFLVGHPLLRHLVRRLLWGAWRGDVLVATFRVAEDASFADANDAALMVDADVQIGIVHPLDIDAATLAAFGQVYADYEIAQPFRQLGREVHRLTDAETPASAIARHAGRRVASGSVIGLERYGWRRDDPSDGGAIWAIHRALPGDLVAELPLDPGLNAGYIDTGVQTLGALTLRRAGTWNNDGLVAFGTLDPIVVSELLRDLDNVPTHGSTP